MKDIPIALEEKMHKQYGSRVKGRAKGFIKIFNIEGFSPKRKGIFEFGESKFKEKDRVKSKVGFQVSTPAAEANDEVKDVHPHDQGTSETDMLESEGIASLYMNSYVPITKDPSPEWSKTSGPSISLLANCFFLQFCNNHTLGFSVTPKESVRKHKSTRKMIPQQCPECSYCSQQASAQENNNTPACKFEESDFEDLEACLVEQSPQKQLEDQQSASQHEEIEEWSKGKKRKYSIVAIHSPICSLVGQRLEASCTC